MSASNLNTYVSWAEVYQMIRARAEASRGVQNESGDGVPDAVPNTTVADGYRVALVFDKAIYDHAESLVSRWTAVSERLIAESEDAPGPYVANRSLWATLATAALELDRAHAPLPDPALVGDALDELTAPAQRPDGATSTPRTEGTARIVTVIEESTWRAMATRQLGFFRTLRGEVKVPGPLMQSVPATSNAEVLALARYWQQQVALSTGGERMSSHDTYHQLVYSWWYAALHQVAIRAKHAPSSDLYPHNAEFWIALLLLTTQSDHSDEVPFPWAYHLADAPMPQQRNGYSGFLFSSDAKVIDFASAKSWDEAGRLQQAAFTKLRGVTDVPDGPVKHVPKTTLGDVRNLTSFWQAALESVGTHNFTDTGYKRILDRWRTEVERVRSTPDATPGNTVYGRNTEFWVAILGISTQIAVTDETPSWASMAKDSVAEAVHDIPTGNWIDKLGAFGRVTGEWLTSAVARPFLYVGGGLLGLTVAWMLYQRSATKGVAERVAERVS